MASYCNISNTSSAEAFGGRNFSDKLFGKRLWLPRDDKDLKHDLPMPAKKLLQGLMFCWMTPERILRSTIGQTLV
jgi:hypothetical protein